MLKELKEKRNILACHMADMTGLSQNTIRKYDDREKVRDENKKQIETMLDVIERNDIVFPDSCHAEWKAYYKELYELEAKCKYLAILEKHSDWQ